MKSLLLIACSSRKVTIGESMPALERYDGGTYRVIRRLQRNESYPYDVDVKIISAEFGLIDANTPIPLYDKRMTIERAKELKPEILLTLENALSKGIYSELCVDLGKDYLATIKGIAVPRQVKTLVIQGRIGERLHHLKMWLLSKSSSIQH